MGRPFTGRWASSSRRSCHASRVITGGYARRSSPSGAGQWFSGSVVQWFSGSVVREFTRSIHVVYTQYTRSIICLHIVCCCLLLVFLRYKRTYYSNKLSPSPSISCSCFLQYLKPSNLNPPTHHHHHRHPQRPLCQVDELRHGPSPPVLAAHHARAAAWRQTTLEPHRPSHDRARPRSPTYHR